MPKGTFEGDVYLHAHLQTPAIVQLLCSGSGSLLPPRDSRTAAICNTDPSNFQGTKLTLDSPHQPLDLRNLSHLQLRAQLSSGKVEFEFGFETKTASSVAALVRIFYFY